MAADTSQQYWLFQYREDVAVNEEVESSQPGDVVHWKLTKFKSEIREGDVVFFWRAGSEAGLKGWGEVAGTARLSPDEGFDRIPVRTECNFGEVIPKSSIRAIVPDLRVVAQGQQGSNFRVASLQATKLGDLIRRSGFPSPVVSRDEAKAVVRRRLQRDLVSVQDAIKQLSPAARKGLESRVAALMNLLHSDDWDSGSLNRELAGLRRDAEEAASSEGAQELPSKGARSVRRAVEQAFANAPDLIDVDVQPSEPVSLDAAMSGTATISATLSTGTATAARPVTAPPEYWHWPNEDRVDITSEVTNLAQYIANEGMRRGQAIGIFGEWGSGKSFFMRALRSQIALTAWQSREARARNEYSSYWTRIVQIDFNAWHYVESNLWASLAGHIFEQLHEALVAEANTNKTGVKLDPDALFKGLATYREAMDNRTRLAGAVKELTDKRDKLVKEMTTQSQSASNAVKVAAGVVAGVVKGELEKLNVEQRERLQKLVGAESIDQLAASAEQLGRVIDEGQGIRGAAAQQIRTMGTRGYVIASALALVGLAAALWFFGFLREGIATLWPALRDNPAVRAFAAGLVSAFAYAATTMRLLARGGRNLLTLARSTHDKIVAEQAKEDKAREPQVTAAEATIADARAALAIADAALKQQREELAAVEAALKQGNPGVQLKAFLEERVRDKSYEQHLGLISLVRRDFQTLSRRMRDQWDRRDDGQPYAEVDEIQEDGSAVKTKVPFVERIVLYVDDLDRCPPDKVVDVLQAVHLLLGFELFVVVVAVDVRWVGRSLTKHYGDLLSSTDVNDEEHASWDRASSDDYLEKIFQIPFRIVPLSNTAREQFVRLKLREPFMGAPVAGSDPDIPVVDLASKEFKLYPEEENSIAALHQCLGRSPRRVERFMNVYRLMRAGMEAAEVDALIKGRSYPELLGLFALLTGSARLGPKLIERLHSDLRRGPLKGNLSTWLKKYPGFSRFDEDERVTAELICKYLDGQRNGKGTETLTSWMPRVAQYSFREIRLPGT